MQENEVIIIGITGGIGTGKSEVAKIIEKSGLPVLNMDAKAKDLINSNTEIKKSIIDEFGENSYSSEGKLNSKFISDIIYNNDEKLLKLNSIVHPFAINDMMNAIENLIEAGEKLIFVESALIYEAELEEGFDYIIVVDAPDEIRIERIIKRNGLTREYIEKIISSQIPMSEKKAAADYVIDNTGSLKQLEDSVNFITSIYRSLINS